MSLRRPPWPPEVDELPAGAVFAMVWNDGDSWLDRPWATSVYRVGNDGPIGLYVDASMFRWRARRKAIRIMRNIGKPEIIRG
jgi:hypothetical protein